jgi:hypothetical protein
MGNFYRPLDPIPLPQSQSVELTPPPQVATEVPRGAGYAGKAAQTANLLSNFLRGWQTGVRSKEERSRKKMDDELSTANTAVQSSFENWRRAAADPNADQKKTEEAKNNYQNQVGILETLYNTYMAPVEEKKKKQKSGVGGFFQRMGQGFTGQDPVPSAGIQAIIANYRAAMPEGPSAQARVANVQAGRIEGEEKERTAIKSKLDSGQQLSEQEKLSAERFGLTRAPSEKLANFQLETVEGDVNRKKTIQAKLEGGQALTTQEKEDAYRLGLRQRPKVEIVPDTTTGQVYAVSVDPTTMISTKVPIGIKTRVQPNEFDILQKQIDYQYTVNKELLKKAYPNASDEQIHQIMARSKFYNLVPSTPNMSLTNGLNMVSRAIQETWAGLTPEDKMKFGPLVKVAGGGRYIMLPEFPKEGTGHEADWFNSLFAGKSVGFDVPNYIKRDANGNPIGTQHIEMSAEDLKARDKEFRQAVFGRLTGYGLSSEQAMDLIMQQDPNRISDFSPPPGMAGGPTGADGVQPSSVGHFSTSGGVGAPTDDATHIVLDASGNVVARVKNPSAESIQTAKAQGYNVQPIQ